MSKITCIFDQKSGISKTTTAFNLEETRASKFLVYVFIALMLAPLGLSRSANAQAVQRRRAVLVGINRYRLATPEELEKARPLVEQQEMLRPGEMPPPRDWSELYGAVRDVQRISAKLSLLGFTDLQENTLTDEAATRAAILKAIKTVFIDEARDGDVLVFYFSGHGSQMKNSLSATKKDDYRDETIVPWDASVGYYDIRDKELARLFNQAMATHQVTITAIFDSCHSGTMVRNVGSRKLTAKDDLPDPRDSRDAYGAKPEEAPPEKHGALILTAARKDQSALETYDDEASDPQQADRAETFANQNNPTEGIPVAKQALALAEQTVGKDSLPYGKSLCILGRLLEENAQHSAALRTLQQCVEVEKKADGENSRYLMEAYLGLAVAWDGLASKTNDMSSFKIRMYGAESNARKALRIADVYFGPDDPARRFILTELASVQAGARKSQAAANTYTEILRLTQLVNPDPDYRETLGVRTSLGDALIDAGRQAEGMRQLLMVQGSARRLFGDQSPAAKAIAEDLRRPFGGDRFTPTVQQAAADCTSEFHDLRVEEDADDSNSPANDKPSTISLAENLGPMDCQVSPASRSAKPASYSCRLSQYVSTDSILAAVEALKDEIAVALPGWRRASTGSGGEDFPGARNFVAWNDPVHGCTLRVYTGSGSSDSNDPPYYLHVNMSGPVPGARP